VPYKGRASIIGKLVESELVQVVERYSTHGVPMTNYILRCNLMEVNKRMRLSNTMIGEVRKGKYSK